MRRMTIAATLFATLCLPTVASAHVTLQPGEAPAGGFERLDVRVPNESDGARTRPRSRWRYADGFIFLSTEPVSGWTETVKKGEARRARRGVSARNTPSRSRASRSRPTDRGWHRASSRTSASRPGCRTRLERRSSSRRSRPTTTARSPAGSDRRDADEPAPTVQLLDRRGRCGVGTPADTDTRGGWLLPVRVRRRGRPMATRLSVDRTDRRRDWVSVPGSSPSRPRGGVARRRERRAQTGLVSAAGFGPPPDAVMAARGGACGRGHDPPRAGARARGAHTFDPAHERDGQRVSGVRPVRLQRAGRDDRRGHSTVRREEERSSAPASRSTPTERRKRWGSTSPASWRRASTPRPTG